MSACGDLPTGRMRRVKSRAGSATGPLGLRRAQMMQKTGTRRRFGAPLAAAKARGVKLAAAAKSAKATARATDLLPVIAEVRAAGVATLSGIAKALTARGVPTPSGRGAWSPATVMRLDRRVQAA